VREEQICERALICMRCTNAQREVRVNGKLCLLTPCCCGWGDGSMIFNPNARAVAPPQSSGVSAALVHNVRVTL